MRYADWALMWRGLQPGFSLPHRDSDLLRSLGISESMWKLSEPSWGRIKNLDEQAKACSTWCGTCFSLFVSFFKSCPASSAEFLGIRRSETHLDARRFEAKPARASR